MTRKPEENKSATTWNNLNILTNFKCFLNNHTDAFSFFDKEKLCRGSDFWTGRIMRRAVAGAGTVFFPHGFKVLETSHGLHLSKYVTQTLSLVVKLVFARAKELLYQNCLL